VASRTIGLGLRHVAPALGKLNCGPEENLTRKLREREPFQTRF